MSDREWPIPAVEASGVDFDVLEKLQLGQVIEISQTALLRSFDLDFRREVAAMLEEDKFLAKFRKIEAVQCQDKL